jgi:hypothetical protein
LHGSLHDRFLPGPGHRPEANVQTLQCCFRPVPLWKLTSEKSPAFTSASEYIATRCRFTSTRAQIFLDGHVNASSGIRNDF